MGLADMAVRVASVRKASSSFTVHVSPAPKDLPSLERVVRTVLEHSGIQPDRIDDLEIEGGDWNGGSATVVAESPFQALSAVVLVDGVQYTASTTSGPQEA